LVYRLPRRDVPRVCSVWSSGFGYADALVLMRRLYLNVIFYTY
jgi:hypothetical protein